jgi:hypothetical protein
MTQAPAPVGCKPPSRQDIADESGSLRADCALGTSPTINCGGRLAYKSGSGSGTALSKALV